MSAALTRSRIEGWDRAARALADAGRRWSARADNLDTSADVYLRHISRPGGSRWAGSAADAALATALGDRQPVFRAADRARGMSTVALRGADSLLAAQARALRAIAAAESDGFVVDEDLSLLDTGCYSTAERRARRRRALDHLDRIDQHAHTLQAADADIAVRLHAGADDQAADLPLGWGSGGDGTDKEGPKWTAADLYRGDPSAADINQDALGDCYLVATLGAIANASPQWIRDRIGYDPATGNFDVTLWDGDQWRHIRVSQGDIDVDIAVHGGSGVDNGDPGAPLWPTVIEAAYAKLQAPDMSIEQALIHGIGAGGQPTDALQAVVGNRGRTIHPSIEWFTTQHIDQQISDALRQHQPVTISTTAQPGSLEEHHVYTVERITGTGSDAQVTLRNPWGPDNGPALITVRLGDLIGSGIPGAFGFGPVQTVNIGRF